MMRNVRSRLSIGLACLGMFATVACTSLLAPVLKPDVSTDLAGIESGDWQLDPKHAALIFRIDHLEYSKFVGRFERFDVQLDGQADTPSLTSVVATVDITSLNIANDAFAETLMGSDWFDAAAFPQAEFRSTRVVPTSDTTADVEGILILHGKSAPVTLSVTFNGAGYDRLRGADIAGFSATARIDRTEFGVSKFSGLITDMVDIEIEAELMKTAETP